MVSPLVLAELCERSVLVPAGMKQFKWMTLQPFELEKGFGANRAFFCNQYVDFPSLMQTAVFFATILIIDRERCKLVKYLHPFEDTTSFDAELRKRIKRNRVNAIMIESGPPVK